MNSIRIPGLAIALILSCSTMSAPVHAGGLWLGPWRSPWFQTARPAPWFQTARPAPWFQTARPAPWFQTARPARLVSVELWNDTGERVQIYCNGAFMMELGASGRSEILAPEGDIPLSARLLKSGTWKTFTVHMHRSFMWRLRGSRNEQQSRKPVPVPDPSVPHRKPEDRHGSERSNSNGAAAQSHGPEQEQTFYTQIRLVSGILIKAPSGVRPEALDEAERWVRRVLANSASLGKKLAEGGVTIVVFARHQKLTDLPETEYLRGRRTEKGDLYDHCPGITLSGKTAVLGEANLLCSNDDPCRGEAVLVHELAHIVSHVGFDGAEKSRLEWVYKLSKKHGRWAGTYASENMAEYFAELTQMYFGVAASRKTRDVNGSLQLKEHDPEGYEFVDAVFSDGWVPRQSIQRQSRIAGQGP